MGDEVVQAVVDDWETAPIDERRRAALGFLQKLTLEPASLAPADADAARTAGVSDEALEDAIDVAALFNVIDRVADSLAFRPPSEVLSPELRRRGAEIMLERGYR